MRFFWHREPKLWCLRIGRLCLKVKDTRTHRLLFSERNGYWHVFMPMQRSGWEKWAFLWQWERS